MISRRRRAANIDEDIMNMPADDMPPDEDAIREQEQAEAAQKEFDAQHQTMTVKINKVIWQSENAKLSPEGVELRSYILGAIRMGDGVTQRISLKVDNQSVVKPGETYVVTSESISEYRNEPQVTVGIMRQAILKHDHNGMKQWLESHVAGFGPATSQKLLDCLLENGIRDFRDVLGNTEVLHERGEISLELAERISSEWNKDSAGNELFTYLIKFRDHQGKPVFNKRQIRQIIEQKGELVKDIINNNPWLLIREINGIGFATADALALSVGADMNSPLRIQAAVAHFMQNNVERNGDCCAEIDRIAAIVGKELNIDRDLISNMITESSEQSRDDLEDASDDWFVVEDGMVYRTGIYRAETKMVDKIVRMMERGPRISREHALSLVEKVSAQEGIKLDDSQIEAAVTSLQFPVVVITGGPGTGKSTIQKVFMKAMDAELNLRISASCPTGKGARRQAEASGYNATTIHRQLEASAEGFRRDASNPLDAQSVIVDEASMEDTLLAEAQLQAMKDDAQIVYVGDVNQIPSVGAGQVLKDMIMSGLVPVCVLERTHRQANGSSIPEVAKRILEGKYPVEDGEKLRGVKVIELPDDDIEVMRQRVVDYVRRDLPMMGLSPEKDLTVLAPTNAEVGELNSLIKKSVNSSRGKESQTFKEGFGYGAKEKVFTVRDVVMHIENNSALGVNNGETGIVVGFSEYTDPEDPDSDKKTIVPVVDFDGRQVTYTPDTISQVVHARAKTYHKEQGSEQVIAVVACPGGSRVSRNLLYTGFTRGKSESVIIGTRKAIMEAVLNEGRERKTGLRKRLHDRIGYIRELWENNDWDTGFLERNQTIINKRIEEEERIHKHTVIAKNQLNRPGGAIRLGTSGKPTIVTKSRMVLKTRDRSPISIKPAKTAPEPQVSRTVTEKEKSPEPEPVVKNDMAPAPVTETKIHSIRPRTGVVRKMKLKFPTP